MGGNTPIAIKAYFLLTYQFTEGALSRWLTSIWWFSCPDFSYFGFPISLETRHYVPSVGERREHGWG